VLKRTTQYSGLSLVIHLAALLYWQTDFFIINHLLLDPLWLVGFSVMVSFIRDIGYLATLGCEAVMPAATALHAAGEIARLSRMLYRANRFVIGLVAPMFLFFVFFGREFMALYLGVNYRDIGVLFGVLGIAAIFTASRSVPSEMCRAYGRIGKLASFSLLWAALTVILALNLMALTYGRSYLNVDAVLWSIAIATVVIAFVDGLVWMPIYISRLLGVRWLAYIIHTNLLPLVHCVPIALVLLLFRLNDWGHTWFELIAVVLISGSIHVVYMIAYGLCEQDRASAKNLIKRAVGSIFSAQFPNKVK